MPEVYPCRLPGILVNSQEYQDQNLVDRNDLSSGPPVFRQRSEDGWMEFGGNWVLNGLEVQVLREWHRQTLKRGSKSFTIGLMIDGFDGTKQVIDHTCYFLSPPKFSQRGRLWSVSAQLLAISQVGFNECDTNTLVNTFNGFEHHTNVRKELDQAVDEIETAWQL